MKKQGTITVEADTPPIVELDTEANAAYVRFSREEVVRTDPVVTDGCIVTVDYDTNNRVIGIELIGVTEFGVNALLQKAQVSMNGIPRDLLEKTRYVSSSLVNS